MIIIQLIKKSCHNDTIILELKSVRQIIKAYEVN